MYALIKPLLFLFDAERAHCMTLSLLQITYRLGLMRLFYTPLQHTPLIEPIMKLSFPNRIGLAAGVDKNGDYIDALASLGFGFIEIGTLTPKPQLGNPKPRLFRLTKQQAIINRMGFNNKGVEYAIANLKKMAFRGILGINIGKNKETPIEKSVDDYLYCMRALWPYASYFTINISSPNTPELRNLQQRALLHPLLTALKQEQAVIHKKQHKYIPLVVKISPDITAAELHDIATILLEHHIDGVIATNTTLSRHGVEESPYAHEAGGLSGTPLQAKSNDLIQQLRTHLNNDIPIIGVGGIIDANTAQEKINAGATLLQLYSGLVYKGPRLIQSIIKTLQVTK